MLTQQCGRCLRWCCPECYAPWTALACGACRAEARAAVFTPYSCEPSAVEIESEVLVPGDASCRERSRARGTAGSRRHRERADVRTLADRVADLERRLAELRPGG